MTYDKQEQKDNVIWINIFGTLSIIFLLIICYLWIFYIPDVKQNAYFEGEYDEIVMLRDKIIERIETDNSDSSYSMDLPHMKFFNKTLNETEAKEWSQ